MQVSDNTLNVLKNFATINPSLLFPAGSQIATLSPKKNIMAKATIDESIPKKFAIYDLNQFLGVVSLFKAPEFDIKEQHVTIKNGNGHSSNYFFADESMIDTPPDKVFNIDPVVNVDLEDAAMKSVISAARVMALPHVTIESSGTEVLLKACNIVDSGSNTYELTVGETDVDFRFIFSVENLRFIPGKYNLQISKEGVAKFALSTGTVEYYVATEHESKYNG
jgi:hypothetical protein